MTSPADTAPLRIAHISDIHVGAANTADLRSLVDDVDAAGVAATVVTGDLTMRARTREFVHATQLVGELPSPTLTVIGNHDIPLLNPVRRARSPYQKFRVAMGPDLDPLLDLGAARIQGLGSVPRWRWKSGRVSERQAALIRTTFADAPGDTVRIVAMHHPPTSAGLETIAGADDFGRALVDAAVDVVLAGHRHVPAETPVTLRSGTRSHTIIEVVAGTASTRTRGVDRSWSLLELTPQTLTVTPRFDHTHGWQAGPSQTFPLRTDDPSRTSPG